MTATKIKFPIKELRRARGMSQDTLARACDTTRDRISIWERSHQTPRLDLQVSLARAFKMQLSELQRLCDWPETPYLQIVEVDA